LRSPVRRAARIFVMSGAGAAALRRACLDSSALVTSASAWPQFAQNLASAAVVASQRGQVRDADSTVMGSSS
jgi:hypothetical protein